MKTRLYKKLFFVYSIRVIGHRMNYIGVTNNIDNRRNCHLLQISRVVKSIKNESETFPFRTLSAHIAIAKYLLKKFDNPFVFREVKIKILDIFDNPFEAGRCESRHIKSHTKLGGNLNVQKNSSYVFNKVFKVQHPIRKKEKHKNGILIYQDGHYKFYSTIC